MITVILVAAIPLAHQTARSNGLNKTLKVNGAGISIDYARTRYDNDVGLYASYRYGFVHILSAFFSAEAGYRFLYGSVNARAGGQVMLMFVGLEAGILSAYRTRRVRGEWYERAGPPGPWAPGAYVGLAGVLPSMPLSLFLSTGGNFYFINHDIKFYFMVTGLFNFAR